MVINSLAFNSVLEERRRKVEIKAVKPPVSADSTTTPPAILSAEHLSLQPTVDDLLVALETKGYPSLTMELTHLSKGDQALFEEVLQGARNWIRLKKQGFLLASTTNGCGKTHIARAMMAVSSAKLYRVWDDASRMYRYDVTVPGIVVSSPDLLRGFTENDFSLCSAVPPSSGVVVFDDVRAEGLLGYVKQTAEAQTSARHARWFEIIEHCDRYDLRVIITTNIPPSENTMQAYFGSAAWDRLCKIITAGCRWDLTGVPSYRRKIGGY